MELSYESHVNDNGKLLKSVSEKIAKELLGFKGKKVTIIITDEVDRTNRQNRLYRLYVKILADHTGNTTDEMHKELKTRFMPFTESTTDLSQKEFSVMINEIIVWAATYLEVILPDNES